MVFGDRVGTGLVTDTGVELGWLCVFSGCVAV